MKPLLVLALIALAVCSSQSAHADSAASNTTILELQLDKTYPGIVFIKLSAPPTGKPACSNHFWDYTLPLSGALDDKFYATLLAAYAGKSNIDIGGLGVCSEFPMVESLRYVALKN